MKGFRLYISGIVQGVGFRPFIYKLSIQLHLNGFVTNSTYGVLIELNAPDDFQVQNFIEQVKRGTPQQSIIEEIHWEEIPVGQFDTFSIRDSEETGNLNIPLTPDFALCEQCREEIYKEGRRHQYAFTTCTHCGPRYSIINKMPYDRPYTEMHSFQMCHDCIKEYHDPQDRRFYSQTNSCPTCAITMKLVESDGHELAIKQEQITDKVAELLIGDKIISVKGIGGYLLLADATSRKAITALRQRKNRPGKPFALLYPDIQMAGKDVIIDDQIVAEWESQESPIVLCRIKENLGSGIHPDLIAPSLNQLGIMIPYAPLLELIAHRIGKPLIATSGNMSGSPIIYNDRDALINLSQFADYHLMHDRNILIPQDDSVVRFSSGHKNRIILRRSRGMAPGYPVSKNYKPEKNLLSMGAMLKSAFGLSHNGRFYLSQFLGNTATLESMDSYEHVLQHLMKVLKFTPEVVLVDKHPDYPASILGNELAGKLKVPEIKTQHHKAHAYAVLGENNLINTDRILAVVWDGTGLGDDGMVWGGEFFMHSKNKLDRIGQWDYFPHILSDKMALEPRISAFALTSGDDMIQNQFSDIEWHNYSKMMLSSKLKTSSVGRLFDGVASLLGLIEISTYEGEAAMYLETVAEKFHMRHPGYADAYEIPISEDNIVSTSGLIQLIKTDINNKVDKGEIAFKFHRGLARMIGVFAGNLSASGIALSGGVFQNGLLVDLIVEDLNNRFNIYFHKHLSPNDECIAYGQMMAYLHEKGELES